jgi:hypothetical protein
MGFETAIPASDRSQTHALDRTATGIGVWQTHSEKPTDAEVITNYRFYETGNFKDGNAGPDIIPFLKVKFQFILPTYLAVRYTFVLRKKCKYHHQ